MSDDIKNKRIKLYEKQGETSRYVDAEITQDGDITISGQDIGKIPEEYWGDSDYEFMVYVAAKYKDDVFHALVEKLNNECNDEEFLDYIKSRKILWVHLPVEQKDYVLLALIKKLYYGNSGAVDDFKDFMRSQGVPAEFGSWV